MFETADRVSRHLPTAVQVESPASGAMGSAVGFAFSCEDGVYYTNHHVTSGRPLIVPNRNADGTYSKVVLKAVQTDENADFVGYGGASKMARAEVGEYGVVVNPVRNKPCCCRRRTTRALRQARSPSGNASVSSRRKTAMQR